MPERERVTEIGGWESVDLRRHPLAAALAMVGLVTVFVVALVGLGVAFREGDRRVAVGDVVVPSVEGLTEDAARALLEETGLIMAVSESPNELVAAGQVFDQEPLAGSILEMGSPVTAMVSTGPAGTIVPDTVGQQVNEAQTLLSTVGLTAVAERVYDEDVRPGEVLGSDPRPGRRAPPDGNVRIQISDGPAPRAVPAIDGRTSAEVLAELGRLRLIPGSVSVTSGSGQPDGSMLAISPAAGSQVPRGSVVDVEVAGPADPVVMPSVTGLLESTAGEALADAGVAATVRRIRLPTGDSRSGRVLRQGVAAGSVMSDGLVVEIVVGVAPPPPTTAPPRTTAPPPTTTSTIAPAAPPATSVPAPTPG